MSLLTIQEALNEINGSTGLTQQEAANELAIAVAAVASSGALTLTNTTTENTISVDQNGNVGTLVATDGAVHIENTGNTGIGLGVYTNIGATADAPLVSIHADNVAFDQSVLYIRNDGVSNAIYIEQNGVLANNTNALWVKVSGVQNVHEGILFEMTNTSSNQEVLKITNAGTGGALLIQANGVNTGGKPAVYIYSNAIQVNDPLLSVRSDNSSSSANTVYLRNDGTGTNVLIDSDGTGIALSIDHDDTGSNTSLNIDRDGNNVARIFGMTITVDNVGVGNLVGGIDFSGMSDTEPLFKLTSTDTDLSTKSPETDAESGWFPVLVGTTTYAVPIYALS